MNKEKQRFLQCRAQDIRITGLKMVQGEPVGASWRGVFYGGADGGALF